MKQGHTSTTKTRLTVSLRTEVPSQEAPGGAVPLAWQTGGGRRVVVARGVGLVEQSGVEVKSYIHWLEK